MSVTAEFRALAEEIVEESLAADPVRATWLGDHRHDDRLPDRSPDAVEQRLRRLDSQVTALDAVDDVELDVADAVDLEILRAELLRELFELDEVRRLTWDPMVWNPGTALHLLLIRDFAPVPERAKALRGRVAGVGEHFRAARSQLDRMSSLHVETAIGQLAGTRRLLDGDVRRTVADDRLVDRAIAEVDEFTGWLDDRLADADRDPRLGEHLYAGALWHALDDDVSASTLLADAQAQLDLITEQLQQTARDFLGTAGEGLARQALDEVARLAPVSNETVLPLMERALDRTTAFVRARDLVTVPSLSIRLVDMPAIHRGVAVAYCDAPGPLETADVPTYVAVAPTPDGWEEQRVLSFYREYNGVQLHDLAVHEAMPGHVLQLATAQTLQAPSRVRRFGRSGMFIEGWAVYAEELMARHGYAPWDGDPRAVLAFRLQQLKMQARSAINTILDIGVHTGEMDEATGLSLMHDRGFQEEGEALGKWRRALLTSAQLPTYFAGHRAVRSIVDDLRVLHPQWSERQVHDLVLSVGSPAPRHLRTLLGI